MKLSLNNVSFSYKEAQPVLNGFTLNIPNCKRVAIVGVSGSGKSTLLNLISGLIDTTNNPFFSGTISIDNKCPSDFIKKSETSYLFQNHTLFPYLNVMENIKFPLTIRSFKTRQINDKERFTKVLDETYLTKSIQDINNALFEKMVEAVGLSEYRKVHPHELSGGMKRRVALAQTFITNPKLLLLDEPFSSLDVKWKSYLYQDLSKLVEIVDTTLILVTHGIIEALTLTNHIIVIGNTGQVVGELVIDKDLPRFPEEILTNLKEEYDFLNSKLLESEIRNFAL